MQAQHEVIRTLGGRVAAIVLARTEALAPFLQEQPLPFPLLADPEGAAYRAFGLGRTSWATMLRPDVVLRYLGLLWRGWRPRTASAGEDLLQLGGDFVLDAKGRVVFAYRSREPTDRPAVGELVEALRRAGEPPPRQVGR